MPGCGLLDIKTPEDFSAAFSVPRETCERLRTYSALLEAWQEKINLVARSTMPALWQRHMADSAQLDDLAPDARLWIDLGSGAGFPGMVIALMRANRQGFGMHLVESTGKKCAFLAEVARATGAPVVVHQARVEALGPVAAEPPDVISARALAPLDRLLSLAAPLFGPRSVGLFMKGVGAADEVSAARTAWRFDADIVPSRTEPKAGIVVIRNLARKSKQR